MRFWKQYLDSFQFRKSHLYILSVDIVFVALAVGIFSFFNTLLEKIAAGMMPAQTAEQMDQFLISATAQQLGSFSGGMQTFVITFLGGTVLVVVLAFLLCSLARALIWNKLAGKKLTKKTYWKWNGLNLALILPLVGFFIVYAIVKYLVLGLIEWITTNYYVLGVGNAVLNFFFALLFLNVLFLVYHGFVKRYKVWESIGYGFEMVKKKFKDFYKMFLMQLATLVVIGVIFMLCKNFFLMYETAGVVVNVAVSLLILAWMRVYVMKVMV